MRRAFSPAFVSSLAGFAAAFVGTTSVAQNGDSLSDSVLEANTRFDNALASDNRGVLDTVLDPEFTWIFPDGSYYGRSDTLQALPDTATSTTGEPSAVAERAYGRVRALEVSSGLAKALRIWALRPDGWRLLHMNEVVKAPERTGEPRPYRPSYRDTVDVMSCDNPCEAVPYVPATQRSLDALRSWQQQELGSHLMDMELWGSYVTDEWISQRAGSPQQTKDGRIRGTNVRAENGVTGSTQATVLQMRLYDLEDAVLMVSLTQGLRGRPEYRTRIFVRDGQRADGGDRYKMAESYGQAVAASAVFERRDRARR
jgi:hypothetical protein